MPAPKTPLVLIADDDPHVLNVLKFQIEGWGCRVATAPDKGQLYRTLDGEIPALVMLDVRFGEHDGVELLQELVRKHPDLIVIMMTAFGSIDSAVAAMKLGAIDYLTKPPDLNRLKVLVGDAIAKASDRSRAGAKAPKTSADVSTGSRLIGQGPAIARIRELVAAVAPTDASVLILGESGTGKEVVARSIHAQSRRTDSPFVALNMAALPRELVESTLFGHEKGAFTGADQPQAGSVEAADRGTLFLDEIGEMDVGLQAKLLRFLQERTFQRVGSSKPRAVDVRILAATNREPQDLIQKGQLRADLYYRLNVVPIVLTPLRERCEDVPALADYFLRRVASRYGKALEAFSPEALEVLSRYDWPGNVRQLENLIERMAIFSAGPVIGVDSVPPEVTAPAGPPMRPGTLEDDASLRPIDQIEKQAIEEALRKSRGNVREAAKLLGLGQATVYRKIKRYGINSE